MLELTQNYNLSDTRSLNHLTIHPFIYTIILLSRIIILYCCLKLNYNIFYRILCLPIITVNIHKEMIIAVMIHIRKNPHWLETIRLSHENRRAFLRGLHRSHVRLYASFQNRLIFFNINVCSVTIYALLIEFYFTTVPR